MLSWGSGEDACLLLPFGGSAVVSTSLGQLNEENRMRVCLLSSVCLTVVVGLAGCADEPRRDGPELVRVSGTIVLDSEPVEGAHIKFIPETRGPVAFAVSDKRGRYELRTFDPGDGAVPGKYGISVTQEITEGGIEFESQAAMEAYVREHGERPPPRRTVNMLPKKYSATKTSGFTAEISVAKKNRSDLELSSESSTE